MKAPAFPQELFDFIIDFLTDDLETLRSCALVASRFYRRARVFSHLRIGPLDQKHTITDLHKLLEGSASFAAGVKSLHLWDDMADDSWMIRASSEPAQDLASGKILPVLVSLTRLCITINIGQSISWVNISSSLRNSIRLTLTRPNFTCLELTRVQSLPFMLLAQCPALRSLTLKWVSFNPHFAVATCAGSRPTQLEHLSLSLEGSSLDLLVHWILLPKSRIDISSLRSLSCTIALPRNDGLIQRLLAASAPSLQRLCLKNWENFPDATTLDLHKLAHLQTLDLRLCLDIAIAAISLGTYPRELEERMLSLRNIVFPPLQKTLSVDVVLYAELVRPKAMSQLVSVPATLPFTTSLAIILAPAWDFEIKLRAHKLVDVTSVFVQGMRLAKQELRILKSTRFCTGKK
ncbi:hypothetical protein K438DRAFT_1829377 [Mycena galopus ATCC 62051]|nr:hypothetical protein K438DRAFT_1829377 [Mycena galopus ATCC 62051]